MEEGSRKPVRYAITDLAANIPASLLDAAGQRRMRFAQAVSRWSDEPIDFIQLREKSLEAGEIFALAQSAMTLLRGHTGDARHRPRLLVNGRPDLAAAAGADGVHLTGGPGELSPVQAREVFLAAGLDRCVVSVSCHTLEDVAGARRGEADLILFGPVFGKTVLGQLVSEAQGLAALQAAVGLAAGVPVLALGGITRSTIEACLEAGAAGVAAIRLFSDAPVGGSDRTTEGNREKMGGHGNQTGPDSRRAP